MRIPALLVVLALAVPAFGGSRRPQTDPHERTPGPVRFMPEVEVLDPDGQHVFLDGGTFDTLAQAVAEVERISRDGVCVGEGDAGDVELVAVCYPPRTAASDSGAEGVVMSLCSFPGACFSRLPTRDTTAANTTVVHPIPTSVSAPARQRAREEVGVMSP